MKIKDKILSEISEEVKQRVRDTANKLVMKQETVEEVAENESEYLADWEDKEMYQKGFIQGAKWQQERSYSEEDMIEFGNKMQLIRNIDFDGNIIFSFEPSEFIEQFKKK